MKIGIIKEGKVPVDHRVPFTPKQCRVLKDTYQIDIVVEPSNIRCFTDDEYVKEGIQLSSDLSDCDVLFGVKEVPTKLLLPNKTYFFFSHTIKKQAYNKSLLQDILEKKIQLVDYECLKNKTGNRIVAFGRWAGIVGAYNSIRTYGLKYGVFSLKPAHTCFDLIELVEELKKINLDTIKICLTGRGRVSRGAAEVLLHLNVQKVSVEEYLHNTFNHPVYVQLDTEDYNTTIDGGFFNAHNFYANPSSYKSNFARFLPATDMLIAGAYWDPNAPVLFTMEDTKSEDFRIKIIADITCDIEGSIPTTIRPSTIADPFYDIDIQTGKEISAFTKKNALSVMAVDNLPCELPRDASEDFGNQLVANIGAFFSTGTDSSVEGASITTKTGELAVAFSYLEDYVNGD